MKKLHFIAVLTAAFFYLMTFETAATFGRNIAAGDDRQSPQLVISTPQNNSRHNYFVSVTGTAVDQPYVEYNGRSTEPSGIEKVRVMIFADGKVWNGREWFLPPMGDDFFALEASVSGGNWTLNCPLPAEEKQYVISAQATDRAGNQTSASVSFSVEPIDVSIFDANKYYTGIDFSGDRTARDTEIDRLLETALYESPAGDAPNAPTDMESIMTTGIEASERALKYLEFRRMAAVADGTTKLLVIAKGVDPGTVAFERNSQTEFNSSRKFDCNQKIPASVAPMMTTPIYASIAPLDFDFRSPTRVPAFCTTGEISGDKFSSAIGGGSAASVAFYKKSENRYYWLALYTVPPNLENIENSVNGHLVSLSAAFTPAESAQGSSAKAQKKVSAPLFLRNPPVLLVHGLNDNSDSWAMDKNTILQDAGFDVRLLDYRATNGESFDRNKLVLLDGSSSAEENYDPMSGQNKIEMVKSDGIRGIIKKYRKGGVAISKIDVVAHSMGGNLARLAAAQESEYLNDDNFKKGYIRRLITVGTPHLGSNVANILINDVARYGSAGCGKLAFVSSGGERASVDLQIGSPALSRIGRTAIPSHAIVSTDQTNVLRGDYYKRFLKVKACLALNNLPVEGMLPLDGFSEAAQTAFIESICAKQKCDWTVSAESQRGGLADSFVTTLSGRGTEAINHGEEIGSVVIRRKVIELLEGGGENFAPDGFPPVSQAEPKAKSTVNAVVPTLPLDTAAGGDPVRAKEKKAALEAITDLKNLPPEYRAQVEKKLLEATGNSASSPENNRSADKNLNSIIYRRFSGGELFSFDVPENWKQEILGSMTVTFAAENGRTNGEITRGLAIEATDEKWESLDAAMAALAHAAVSKKPFLKPQMPVRQILSNRSAVSVKLTGKSNITGQIETTVFTGILLDSGNLLYVAAFYPESESAIFEPLDRRILDSLKINSS